MRPNLQLKIGQQLTMTPQLQQAIKLLQLSTLELSQEITEQLYSNPLLEIDEESSIGPAHDEDSDNNSETDIISSVNLSDDLSQAAASDATDTSIVESELDQDWGNSTTTDIPVDASWDDNFTAMPSSSPGSGEFDWEQVHQVTLSLQDHLLWQLNLTRFSKRDRNLAEIFIDAVDASGFIPEDIEDMISHHNDSEVDDPYEYDEILAVLHRLQQFDPPGVFARNLQECLLIQLFQLSLDNEYIVQAIDLVTNFINDIGSIDSLALCKKTQYGHEELQSALKLIRSLNPRPGDALDMSQVDYIAPDAYVEKVSGRWVVRLNSNNAPKLRINEVYSDLIKRSDNSDQNQYLKDNLTEAKWFLRSLESRNETLMRVAVTIIELQQDFLELGPIGMKPMILSDIAARLDLHESTISRVTTAKYLSTPKGIFELKYFFSSHVGTSAAGEYSSTAVCAILEDLISKEDQSKPLSDNKLMALLEKQGIPIARRTVAKYRESLGIRSSSQRKRFEDIL
jgi:RNA polymerase sigma-54 factor